MTTTFLQHRRGDDYYGFARRARPEGRDGFVTSHATSDKRFMAHAFSCVPVRHFWDARRMLTDAFSGTASRKRIAGPVTLFMSRSSGKHPLVRIPCNHERPVPVTAIFGAGGAGVRDLIVTENITLDGVIDATGGWFAPAGDDAEVDQSDVEAAVAEQSEAADALLLGRMTFEDMRGYWPLQTDDTTGITDYLNKVSKYVVSAKLQDPAWEHTTVLRGALIDEIQRTEVRGQAGTS